MMSLFKKQEAPPKPEPKGSTYDLDIEADGDDPATAATVVNALYAKYKKNVSSQWLDHVQTWCRTATERTGHLCHKTVFWVLDSNDSKRLAITPFGFTTVYIAYAFGLCRKCIYVLPCLANDTCQDTQLCTAVSLRVPHTMDVTPESNPKLTQLFPIFLFHFNSTSAARTTLRYSRSWYSWVSTWPFCSFNVRRVRRMN